VAVAAEPRLGLPELEGQDVDAFVAALDSHFAGIKTRGVTAAAAGRVEDADMSPPPVMVAQLCPAGCGNAAEAEAEAAAPAVAAVGACWVEASRGFVLRPEWNPVGVGGFTADTGSCLPAAAVRALCRGDAEADADAEGAGNREEHAAVAVAGKDPATTSSTSTSSVHHALVDAHARAHVRKKWGESSSEEEEGVEEEGRETAAGASSRKEVASNKTAAEEKTAAEKAAEEEILVAALAGIPGCCGDAAARGQRAGQLLHALRQLEPAQSKRKKTAAEKQQKKKQQKQGAEQVKDVAREAQESSKRRRRGVASIIRMFESEFESTAASASASASASVSVSASASAAAAAFTSPREPASEAPCLLLLAALQLFACDFAFAGASSGGRAQSHKLLSLLGFRTRIRGASTAEATDARRGTAAAAAAAAAAAGGMPSNAAQDRIRVSRRGLEVWPRQWRCRERTGAVALATLFRRHLQDRRRDESVAVTEASAEAGASSPGTATHVCICVRLLHKVAVLAGLRLHTVMPGSELLLVVSSPQHTEIVGPAGDDSLTSPVAACTRAMSFTSPAALSNNAICCA